MQPGSEEIIVGGMATKRKVDPKMIEKNVRAILKRGKGIHAKRVLSIANAVTGVITAGALAVHAIGCGLAAAKALVKKHAIKQVDRLVGNAKVVVDSFFALWVPYVLADRPKVVVNLDWTDFDDDGHTMLVASVQTSHGRSTPLLWKTVHKSALKKKRNQYEDDLLLKLCRLVPGHVKVTIVADRGFCDTKLYHLLTETLHFDFIIRFRGNILVTDSTGEKRRAKDWVGTGGRMRVLRSAFVTADRFPVATVMCVREKGMKEAWCIVASDPNLKGPQVKRCYGKRFSCEETFRDIKDIHFGLGMRWQRISDPERRDRMMMLAVLAIALLTMLGEAGERAGLDWMLKANTSPKRQLSLFRQGLEWYQMIPNMPEERLVLLMNNYYEVMRQHALCRNILGVL